MREPYSPEGSLTARDSAAVARLARYSSYLVVNLCVVFLLDAARRCLVSFLL